MNQPVEVILILQNMVDQPMQIKVGLQFRVRIKKAIRLSLTPIKRH